MDSRKHDLEELRKDWKTADLQTRRLLEDTAQKIRKESSDIRSMRESLVKEHRNGNKGNIEDIHEFIKGKDKYHNG